MIDTQEAIISSENEEDNIQIKFKFIVFKNNKNKYFHKLISSQYNMINNIYGTRLEGMW